MIPINYIFPLEGGFLMVYLSDSLTVGVFAIYCISAKATRTLASSEGKLCR